MKNYPPELIKSLVKEKGGSLAKLAKRAGFHPTEVQGALYSPIYWGEQIIAEFLNIHPMIIWPDRYDKKGNPLHPYASAKNLKPFCPACKEKRI